MRRARDRRPPARKVFMHHTTRRVILATLFAALVLPGTAAAAIDVARNGDALVVTGSTTGETQIAVDADSDGLFISASEVTLRTSDADCDAFDGFVTCGTPDATSLNVSLNGTGDDDVEISGLALDERAAVTVNLGAGDDVLSFSGPQNVSADLGDGDDQAFTSDGDDTVRGGPGNDTFRLEAGNDQAAGDGGADTFRASPQLDGADTFDGGSDSPTLLKPYDADTISYAARVGSVTVTLAPLGSIALRFGNGEQGENDGLRSVENILGSSPPHRDTSGSSAKLTGNDGPNRLTSFEGADVLTGAGGNDLLDAGLGTDVLHGGDGGDVIDARSAFWAVEADGSTVHDPDGDTDIDCGDSVGDAVRRDVADVEAIGCESQAPFMEEGPQMSGTAQVGGKLTVVRGGGFGILTMPRVTWYGCPNAVAAQTRYDAPDRPLPGCQVLGQSDTYAPSESDVGRRLVARVELLWPYGDGDSLTTASTQPILPAAAGGPDSTSPPGGGQAGAPSGPFAQAALQLAQRQLGVGAFASNITLGAGTIAYEAPYAKGGRLTLRGAKRLTISGVACERACTLTAKGSVLLVPKAKKKKGKRSIVASAASAKKKKRRPKNKTLTLRTQTISIAAGQLGVVKINVTSAHRKLIKRAKKAKLTFAYSLKYADGTTRKAKKSYLIKIG